MSYKFNPFTGSFDDVGSGNVQYMKAPVATEAALSLVGNSDGDAVVTLDTDFVWVWDGTTSRWKNTGIKASNVGSTPNGQAYTFESVNVGANRTEIRLQLQPADATNPGIITAGTQTIGGDKTFQDDVTVDGIFTVTGGIDAAKIADGSVSNTEFQYINSLTSNAQDQLDAKVDDSEKGVAGGVATLDGGGKVPVSQLPNSVMEFKGVFDPATATFTDASGNAGDVWQATAAGSYDAGSGSITYAIGDWAVHNGSIFQKSLNSNAVASVNGFTGVVVLDSDDISEGATNLYFTDTRARTAVVDDSITDGITDKAPSQNAVFDALALKADQNLGNLTSPTAFNQHLLPDSDSSRNIGSAASRILNIHANYIKDSSANSVLDIESRKLLDSSATNSINFDPVGSVEILPTSGSNPRALKFKEGTNTFGMAISASPSLAADYDLILPVDVGTNGQVLTTNGSGVLSWTSVTDTGITELTGDVTAGPGSGSQVATIAADAVNSSKIRLTNDQALRSRNAADSADIDIIKINSLDDVLIYDGSGLVSIDASARQLLSSAADTTVDYEQKKLFDAALAESLDWETRQLKDPDGLIAIDYDTRTLKDTSEVTSLDFSSPSNVVVSKDIIADTNNTKKLGSSGINFSEVHSTSLYSNTSLSLVSGGSGGIDLYSDTENISLYSLNGINAPTLFFFEASSTNSIGIRASNSLASTFVLTLPTTDGAPNEFLQTDGSGNLSWATPTGEANTASNLLSSGSTSVSNTTNNGQWYQVTSSTPLAQQFLVPATGLTPTSFSFEFTGNANGDQSGQFYVEIRTDNGSNSPTNTVLATSSSDFFEFYPSPFGTNAINLTFTGAPALTANTKYWIVFRYPTASDNTGGQFYINGDFTGTYTNGLSKYENPANTWNTNSGDLYFTLNGTYSNYGTGVFDSKSGVDLRFKSLVGGDGLVLTSNANNIIIPAANTTLSNLTAPTAVNQNLIMNDGKHIQLSYSQFLKAKNSSGADTFVFAPYDTSVEWGLAVNPSASNTYDIGGAARRWRNIYAQSNILVSSASAGRIAIEDTGPTSVIQMLQSLTSPSGNSSTGIVAGNNDSTTAKNLALISVSNSVNNANSTGLVLLESGNKTAGTGGSGGVRVSSGTSVGGSSGGVNIFSGNVTGGTGNSGVITIQTGTSAGGTRGEVSINSRQVNVNSTKIVNLATPTASTDAATKAYVDGIITNKKEQFTLSAGDITNGYVDLLNVAKTDSIDFVFSGLISTEGTDYTVSYTGGAGGKTRITFSAHTPTLVAGDVINIKYQF